VHATRRVRFLITTADELGPADGVLEGVDCDDGGDGGPLLLTTCHLSPTSVDNCCPGAATNNHHSDQKDTLTKSTPYICFDPHIPPMLLIHGKRIYSTFPVFRGKIS